MTRPRVGRTNLASRPSELGGGLRASGVAKPCSASVPRHAWHAASGGGRAFLVTEMMARPSVSSHPSLPCHPLTGPRHRLESRRGTWGLALEAAPRLHPAGAPVCGSVAAGWAQQRWGGQPATGDPLCDGSLIASIPGAQGHPKHGSSLARGVLSPESTPRGAVSACSGAEKISENLDWVPGGPPDAHQ